MNRYEFLKQVESNARTYAATFEEVFESGRGVRITGTSGRELIDCLACAGALPLGHNHAEVQEAVTRFLASGQVQQGLDLATPAKYEFVRELFSLLPKTLANQAKIQFCSPSGSDAVEAAMKLARFATQRNPIIAFHGAYHGMTSGALGAMGNLSPKVGVGATASGIHFAPYPDSAQCPFGSDGSDTDELSLSYLRTILTDPESGIPKPAAVILEIIQGEGGCVPASAKWLRALRELTAKLGILLIVDEVQTGLGRTGSMFAFQKAEIVPDILVLSKAVGGGYPLAVVVYRDELDVWPKGMHAGTFRGTQIAMVAGRATMGIIQRDRLDLRAGRMGELLASGLRQLSHKYPFFSDVRGRGLMLGAQIRRKAGSDRPGLDDGALAQRLKLAAFKRGLLIETGGRYGSVLRFLPPLILEEADVTAILERLESAAADVVKQGEAHGD